MTDKVDAPLYAVPSGHLQYLASTLPDHRERGRDDVLVGDPT